ncbi:DNA polymerase epsilon subunit 3-like [Centruroides sculpturatus]|uniref:DNA polymerase epsilon subunit 3-like n=1 Tax=Centruroides sculpturatus TaxID=218467 RepID=UPI000C6DD73D|nr:DNA polymerase epsilon subunit 3-like [Centruroides sculpturatus]
MAERPEDFNLPNAVVTRIVKEALPDGVNVSKEARAALSKAASVFVLYTTSCANNFAMKAKRKTLLGNDVLSAMEDMEFDRFIEPLKDCLKTYQLEKSKKESGANKGKKKQNVTEESVEEENRTCTLQESTEINDE